MSDNTSVSASSEVLELRREVIRQWFTNHAEHCGVPVTSPFPHNGDCQWYIPEALESVSPDEIYSLFLEVYS
jgi:hypothetical protein